MQWDILIVVPYPYRAEEPGTTGTSSPRASQALQDGVFLPGVGPWPPSPFRGGGMNGGWNAKQEGEFLLPLPAPDLSSGPVRGVRWPTPGTVLLCCPASAVMPNTAAVPCPPAPPRRCFHPGSCPYCPKDRVGTQPGASWLNFQLSSDS